jgi:hypothetical protein
MQGCFARFGQIESDCAKWFRGYELRLRVSCAVALRWGCQVATFGH